MKTVRPAKQRLRIAIIELVTKSPTRTLYSRVMNANLAGIMAQAVAVWCEQEGHDVAFVCYTGLEDLTTLLPDDVDVVMISGFSQAGQLSYALSAMYRAKGAVTVLGGPHARCYPQDARKYFDYVLGFTHRETIRDLLADPAPQRPLGVCLDAGRQPASLPGLRERWKFIAGTLAKAPLIKIVPMIGSLGCPYTCSFCIDADVPYEPIDPREIRDDLIFLRQEMPNPRVAWHDPNFGVRFDEVMEAIEEAAPNGEIQHIAESSLSLLKEEHLARMQKNSFMAVLPGIESWYDLGNKSRTGAARGMDKVRQVSEHVNMILRYVPYLQANFVLGLDQDEGDEPFELTKRFIDMTPAAFPGYSLLSAFGQASPLNLDYQRAGRVLPFPFHLLNNNHAMNVKPLNYEWPEFYDRVIDLTRYSFSWRAIGRRFRATRVAIPRWMNVVRAISSEGFGRLKYYREIRRRLDTDREIQRYFAQETSELPSFYRERILRELGPFAAWLPDGALEHDPCAALADAERRSARLA